MDSQKNNHRYHRITLHDLLMNNYFQVGDHLYHYLRKDKTMYSARILSDGKLELSNGTVIKSLTKAANIISGCSNNGWRWWNYKDSKGNLIPVDNKRKEFAARKMPARALEVG